MIQDILPHVYDNHYEEHTPDDDSYIMFVKGGRVLAEAKGEASNFPLYKDLKDYVKECVYLFSIDDKKYFLAKEYDSIPEEGYELVGLRDYYTYKEKHMAFTAVTAFQLNNWYRNNKFCGRCGKPMTRSHKERMMECRECGNTVYPKISPAVIVAVTDGDRLLMTKYNNREYKRYALIAGFSEVGETLEETVHREVMEEVGVKVKNLQYYKCQPWSFSDSLLVGFFCELDGSDKIKMDEEELSVAEWLHRDEIEMVYDGISLTNEMVIKFKENK
ncbi:MAG: NAD(+) diphosphatase [Firmicutes bacterium]|nr:NAD(+) diphosphatase [Bacillota bacterium]